MTHDPTPAAPWRVAILLDGSRVPAWVATTIETLRASPSVDLVGWSAVDSIGPETIPRAWRAYLRLDERLFGRRAKALRSTVVDPALPRMTTSHGIDDVLASLRGAGPDVIVDLRSRDGPAIRSVAPGGTWVIRHGSQRRPAGPLSYLADVVAGAPAAPAVLIVQGDEPAADRVAYRSVSSVSPISLSRTYDSASWKAARFPIRALARLERDGPVVGLPPPDPTQEPADTGVIRAIAPRMLPFLVRICARLVGTTLKRIARHEAWFVATRSRRDGTIPRDLGGFEAVTPPTGHFYADPFILSTADRTYLFVEDWLPETRRGAISVLELGPTGRPEGAPRRVLERPYHLSYPFVFEHRGRTYLLPETSANGTIELYRALELPDAWEALGPIIRDVQALDPTILEHAGRLWLFAGVAMPGASPWDELWLWSAPALDGPWVEHPANPIVSDARSARPAGRILERDGVLYRPSQDCTPVYGRRIVINRIDSLSVTDYRETPVATIEPRGLGGLSRTHCYDASARFEVIDGRRARWRRPLG